VLWKIPGGGPSFSCRYELTGLPEQEHINAEEHTPDSFHLKSRSNLCDGEQENGNTAFPAANPLLRCPAAAVLAKDQPSEHPLLAGVSSYIPAKLWFPSFPACCS